MIVTQTPLASAEVDLPTGSDRPILDSTSPPIVAT